MRKHAKLLALLLLLVFLASMFIGCKGVEEKPETESQSTTKKEVKATTESKDILNPTGFPIVNEKITLSILKPKEATEVNYEEMEMFKLYEQKSNIHIEWDIPPKENYKERYNLLIASNQLPDIIMGVPFNEVIKNAELGLTIPLNDLIDQYMPSLKSWIEKKPDIGKAIKSSDGKSLYFPLFDDVELGNWPLMVREDWLKEVELDVPATLNDLYDVWKAFKNMDSDIIPFTGTIQKAIEFAAAWGLGIGTDSLPRYFAVDPVDFNSIIYGPIHDRFKECLVWVNKCFNEGLIDNEIITNDWNAVAGKIAQNKVGSFRGVYSGHFSSFNKKFSQEIPGFHLVGTPPIKGPYGEQIHPFVYGTPRDSSAGAMITNACKYPEAAARWIDYFYSDEGAMLINYGVEGETYIEKDGKYEFTEFVLNNPDGLSPKQAIGKYSIQHGGGSFVIVASSLDQLDIPEVVEHRYKYLEPFMETSKKYVMPGTLLVSPKEDAERNEIMQNIQTYAEESIIAFITGRKSFDEWDDYVKNIKAMNIERVIEIYQKAYDNYRE
jgi:putative aldouronate transport system substrate-binding protein